MIKQYKKKPVIIEAIQWTGKNLIEVQSFIEGKKVNHMSKTWDKYESIVSNNGLVIHTLEGHMNASIGDYIIKGIRGEYYPCNPEVFNKIYELL